MKEDELTRRALLVTHTGRSDIVELARPVIERLTSAGFEVFVLAEEVGDLHVEGVRAIPSDDKAAEGVEIVLVLGGDGTFLRAAELARPVGAPLLGVNLGRVGFLAETEPEAMDDTLQRVIDCSYRVEERLTLEAIVHTPGAEPVGTWALNEASLEKQHRERVIEVVLEIDDHALTSFGCDGVLFATPTGSTAYAFSAGGPVVWPSVEAIVVVPNNAHALFASPLVTAADSVLEVELAARGHDAVLCCDGRRTIPVPAGSRLEVRRGDQPVRVARVLPRRFTDRLVAKFALPAKGFRDNRGC
jgi:NAD+ kinase